MDEPGWQPFPGAGVPVELAAEPARDSKAGFRVGDAAFASPEVVYRKNLLRLVSLY